MFWSLRTLSVDSEPPPGRRGLCHVRKRHGRARGFPRHGAVRKGSVITHPLPDGRARVGAWGQPRCGRGWPSCQPSSRQVCLTVIPQAAARPPGRRSDAGHVRLQQRDLDGLLLIADHYAAPYDLLAQALGVPPARLRAVTARWRAAGYAMTGVLGPGPAWCWLTPAGMAAVGHPWAARAPSLSRLAHVRAVLAARLWLQGSPAWQQGGGWWRSERRLRAALPPPRVGTSHVADAEVHWPSSPPGPHAGQV